MIEITANGKSYQVPTITVDGVELPELVSEYTENLFNWRSDDKQVQSEIIDNFSALVKAVTEYIKAAGMADALLFHKFVTQAQPRLEASAEKHGATVDYIWQLSAYENGLQSVFDYVKRNAAETDAIEADERRHAAERANGWRPIRLNMMHLNETLKYAWSYGVENFQKNKRYHQRKAAIKAAGQEPCTRCGGLGVIDHFRHINGGQCFECGGSGIK